MSPGLDDAMAIASVGHRLLHVTSLKQETLEGLAGRPHLVGPLLEELKNAGQLDRAERLARDLARVSPALLARLAAEPVSSALRQVIDATAILWDSRVALNAFWYGLLPRLSAREALRVLDICLPSISLRLLGQEHFRERFCEVIAMTGQEACAPQAVSANAIEAIYRFLMGPESKTVESVLPLLSHIAPAQKAGVARHVFGAFGRRWRRCDLPLVRRELLAVIARIPELTSQPLPLFRALCHCLPKRAYKIQDVRLELIFRAEMASRSCQSGGHDLHQVALDLLKARSRPRQLGL